MLGIFTRWCILAAVLTPIWVASCGGSYEPLPDESRSVDASATQPDDAGGDTLDASVEFPAVVLGTCENPVNALRSAADAGTDAGTPSPTTLRAAGKLIGTALAGHRLSDPQYAETAAREFNYVTPENEMKWDAIEPGSGSFNFGPADAVVQFAEQNAMLVKGHTLVWHSQLPAWVSGLSAEDAVRSAMLQHIEGVIGHYREEFPGRVVAWDVVNEALDSNDGVITYRDSVFYRALGEEFIAEAFRAAREAAPDARLFYNDFAIERIGNKSTATLEMLRDLIEAGVPIDGIGFQMHTGAVDWGPSRVEFEENLRRFTDLGLLVNISEMDASLCFGFDSGEAALEAQRSRYNLLFGTCLQNSRCDSVSLWGVTDRYSWLNSYSPCDDPSRTPAPLAFDENYEKKPAWWGILHALTGCYYWEE